MFSTGAKLVSYIAAFSMIASAVCKDKTVDLERVDPECDTKVTHTLTIDGDQLKAMVGFEKKDDKKVKVTTSIVGNDKLTRYGFKVVEELVSGEWEKTYSNEHIAKAAVSTLKADSYYTVVSEVGSKVYSGTIYQYKENKLEIVADFFDKTKSTDEGVMASLKRHWIIVLLAVIALVVVGIIVTVLFMKSG